MIAAQPPRNRRLKVFGERNTGTRAAMQMLRALEGVSLAGPGIDTPDLDALEERVNASLKGHHRTLFIDALRDVRQSRLPALSAWKHAAPVIDGSYAAKKASVLFMVRDPYSWIVSLFRHPYHHRAPKPEKLVDFLQQPWLAMQRDNIVPVLASPMLLWPAKMQAYRDFAKVGPVPSTVLHFEDFVHDPVGALGACLARFDMPVTGLAEVELPTKKTGLNKEARIAYYANEDWKQALTPAAVRLINADMDWDLAAEFGYRRRAPEEF